MTKYSNTLKKPDSYLKGLYEHFKLLHKGPRYHDKRDTAVNDCWKPSNEATKADIAEFHWEEMKLRKARRER